MILFIFIQMIISKTFIYVFSHVTAAPAPAPPAIPRVVRLANVSPVFTTSFLSGVFTSRSQEFPPFRLSFRSLFWCLFSQSSSVQEFLALQVPLSQVPLLWSFRFQVLPFRLPQFWNFRFLRFFCLLEVVSCYITFTSDFTKV